MKFKRRGGACTYCMRHGQGINDVLASLKDVTDTQGFDDYQRAQKRKARLRAQQEEAQQIMNSIDWNRHLRPSGVATSIREFEQRPRLGNGAKLRRSMFGSGFLPEVDGSIEDYQAQQARTQRIKAGNPAPLDVEEYKDYNERRQKRWEKYVTKLGHPDWA